MSYRNMLGNQFPITKDVIMGGIISWPFHGWFLGSIKGAIGKIWALVVTM